MKRGVATTAGAVVLGVAAALLVIQPAAAAAPAANCSLPVFGPGASYHPHIDPSTFTANVTNEYFPLKPGRTLVYQGTKDGKSAINVFVTTNTTLVVDGVRTRVVEDRLYLDGVLEERTKDYYAQDACGNVWYFGEDTATLDPKGHVISTSGSFRAGVDGAQPGVFMTARPVVGDRYRQEWYVGEAEDTFGALDLSTTITVPYGSFNNALRTKETTALEPAVVDNKYFVRGLGEVKEIAVKGPLERLELVDVIN